LDEAIKAAPEDVMLRHQKAILLSGLGRTEGAIGELDAILDGGIADGNLLSFRAGLLLSIGEAEAAIADIEKAEANGVRSGAGGFIVVRAKLMLGEFEAALAALDAAHADPAFTEDAPLLPIYRFAILERLGRSKEAQEALAEFAAATEPQFVLRMQVFLRNMGFDAVEISGEMDEATRRHFVACIASRACGGSVSRAI
jgi:tetratricopeptide (TPR) repeat protein